MILLQAIPDIIKLKEDQIYKLKIINISNFNLICRIKTNVKNKISFLKNDFEINFNKEKILEIEILKNLKIENYNLPLYLKIFHKKMDNIEFDNCLIINIQTKSSSLIENKINDFLKVDFKDIKKFCNINENEIKTLKKLKYFNPNDNFEKYKKKIKTKEYNKNKINNYEEFYEPNFKYNYKHIVIILIFYLVYKYIF